MAVVSERWKVEGLFRIFSKACMLSVIATYRQIQFSILGWSIPHVYALTPASD